jgi:metal-sulfur cluster biosynthetic enzyme
MSAATLDDEAIWQLLRSILDPEFGINVVDLGLIYSVESADGEVKVVMTLTTRSCPAGSWIYEGIKRAVAELPGVVKSEISLVFDPLWSTEMLSGAARDQLGFVR